MPTMRSPYRLTPATRGLAGYIVLSSAYNRQLMGFLEEFIGGRGFNALVFGVLIAAGTAVLIYSLKKIARAKFWVLVILLVLAFVAAVFMKITAERVHILEYGLLGWLCCRDSGRSGPPLRAAVWAALAATLVGVADELFQKALPYRVCDVRDMITNALSAFWGTAVYYFVVARRKPATI